MKKKLKELLKNWKGKKMQDRFKFRGLSKGKWYYGAYFKHLPYTPYCCGGKPPEKDYKHLIIQEGFSDWGLPRSMTCIEVEKDTVGQCTGLKDKNGLTLLYEGDIINNEGIKIGNCYENQDLLKETTNFIIKGMGTKKWRSSEQEAIKRGCYYAE